MVNARSNYEPSPSFPARNKLSSGTALRDKRGSNQMSQEHVHKNNQKNKSEQEEWEKWRKWQQRLSANQKGARGQD